MKIQLSTNYAVRILQYLHIRKGEILTASEIAESTGITYPFFIKIANRLKKEGLIKSSQGRNGGYLIGKSAREISLYDVFLCMEGELRLCSGKLCIRNDVNACKLHAFLNDLEGKVIEELSEQSIADLIS